ncbi:MAG TPA: acetyl/propionyl/methylcrotonyl-CoA carboxylase subunit alpha [Rhizomicrobium sp.]|nr:acetyl/propionyl/methylcrotonyl-CoA carboxylase subunit alpha [Rhizomicrobium sp.]
MFETILIANRGEIACRVIATCRHLGIRAIAVYSDADANSRHVRLADAAVRIGPPPARESYLAIDRILDAALMSRAQAVHPGYGFLSENAEFAEACARAGIVFIGPPPAAIRAMGSKAAAKELMRNAGVPLTPGYDGTNQDPAFLEQQAGAIGYPVMIKASAGGGGKGMRRVDAPEQFQAALASCKREAASAFGDESVLLEKYVVSPRHVEVQVFGDTHGNIISIFERDCSVQRRHQKVIEEAPAPLITAAQREALGRAAREAARAVGYVGAGTVEFLFDRDGNFYFMEMNTRLQVEHPVTEMITGQDLVEWQLRVAAGEPLPLKQEELRMRGHAIEARIYAEDPKNDFLPSIGKLVHLRAPATSEHLRIDTGVEQDDTITPFYDPMIAKLIVWDETRELAVRRLSAALSEFQIVGVSNNVDFLHRLVSSPSFRDARLDTDLIEREKNWIWPRHTECSDTALLFAVLKVVCGEPARAAGRTSPWDARDGWRLNGRYKRHLEFTQPDRELSATVEFGANEYRITIGETAYRVSAELHEEGRIDAVIDQQRVSATVVEDRMRLYVFTGWQTCIFAYIDPLASAAEGQSAESSLRAPMPGRVIAQQVQTGERVEKGAPLMILEAMKMECTIHAPAAGRVEAFHFSVGDQVVEGAELLHFERDEPQAQEEED